MTERSGGIPDDDWVRRRRAHYPEWATDRPQPELTVTDNPVTKTLLGPKGETLRQWADRPPFGFQAPGEKS